MKSTIFWDITPCSPLSANLLARWFLAQHFACHLLARWFLAELIFSTLKMEAMCSSETLVDTQRTTRCYIPEDGTLHIHIFFGNPLICSLSRVAKLLETTAFSVCWTFSGFMCIFFFFF
jgi:hypothetical protein